jgi:cytochrome c
MLAAPLVHPFGSVRRQRSTTTLPGDSRALPVLERACANCHSQQTKWPAYSYLPVVSWALEKDVAEARRHMDLSRWNQYSAEERADLLARIASEVRNRQMPLPRYRLLHPEARLSDADIQTIYEWTKAERRAIRKQRE